MAVLCRWFPPRVGGVERYLRDVYGTLDGVDVQLFAPREGDWVAYDAQPRAYQISRVRVRDANSKWAVLGFVRELLPPMLRGEIDQIHCGHLALGLIGLAAHHICGMPYVVVTYGSELSRTRFRRLRQRVLTSAARVVTISAHSAELLNALGVPSEQIRTVHPPVNLARFEHCSRSAARRELKLATDTPVAISVCRLDQTAQHKGVDTMLSALPGMVGIFPGLEYWIVGDGDDAHRLHSLARRHGIHQNVRFLGAISESELVLRYAAADVFVLLNRKAHGPHGFSVEGLGIVLIEAAAAGIPAVATAEGGAADVVMDGITGLLLESADEPAVCRALTEVLGNAVFREKLGSAAREHVRERFSHERTRAAMLAVIGETQASSVRRQRKRAQS